jgi:hypothetical protein
MTLTDKQAYESAQICFCKWMIGELPITYIKQLDSLYKPLSGKTFIKHCCDEQRFKSQKDALDCGSFVKRYFETFNKLPDDIPNKHIWYTVLKK